MRPTTYTEAHSGRVPFDWNKFLRNVIRRKTRLPDEEYKQVFDLSSDWVTCACGTMCSIIPRGGRHNEDEPVDTALRDLGITFHKNISNKQWTKAKATLAKIEARSATIINRELEIMRAKLDALGYEIVHKVHAVRS